MSPLLPKNSGQGDEQVKWNSYCYFQQWVKILTHCIVAKHGMLHLFLFHFAEEAEDLGPSRAEI